MRRRAVQEELHRCAILGALYRDGAQTAHDLGRLLSIRGRRLTITLALMEADGLIVAGWERFTVTELFHDPALSGLPRRRRRRLYSLTSNEQHKNPQHSGPRCTIPCDDDCDAVCHAVHDVDAHREHQPTDCPGRRVLDLHDSSGRPRCCCRSTASIGTCKPCRDHDHQNCGDTP